MTGAIFCDKRPATIIKSAWRGDGRKTSAPKRATSKRSAAMDIISIAQQAKPKLSGQMEFLRAQFTALSSWVKMMPSSLTILVKSPGSSSFTAGAAPPVASEAASAFTPGHKLRSGASLILAIHPSILPTALYRGRLLVIFSHIRDASAKMLPVRLNSWPTSDHRERRSSGPIDTIPAPPYPRLDED